VRVPEFDRQDVREIAAAAAPGAFVTRRDRKSLPPRVPEETFNTRDFHPDFSRACPDEPTSSASAANSSQAAAAAAAA